MFRRRTAMALLLLLTLFIGAASVAHAQRGDAQPRTKPARPRLTWSVPRVVQALQPGETRTLQVTLTSDVALEGVRLRVAGGLAGVVQVSPATFDLKAGVPQSITLTLTLPAEHTGSRAGVIQARIGQRNVPRSLKVLVQAPGDDSSGERGGTSNRPGRGKGKGDR